MEHLWRLLLAGVCPLAVEIATSCIRAQVASPTKSIQPCEHIGPELQAESAGAELLRYPCTSTYVVDNLDNRAPNLAPRIARLHGATAKLNHDLQCIFAVRDACHPIGSNAPCTIWADVWHDVDDGVADQMPCDGISRVSQPLHQPFGKPLGLGLACRPT